jgi:hypothetical protein
MALFGVRLESTNQANCIAYVQPSTHHSIHRATYGVSIRCDNPKIFRVFLMDSSVRKKKKKIESWLKLILRMDH